MEGKLIKTDKGNYVLVDPTKSVYDEGYMLGSSRECDVAKLSLKNCQAIERGYDLDELAKHCSKQEYYDWGGEVFEQDYLDTRYTAYKQGFQKCLELMGDKKFSEEDVKFAFNKGYLMKFNPSAEYQKTLNDLRQSIQQTEWDVEIEMERVYDGLDEMAQPQYSKQPKLDENGCLILKRK